MIKRLLSLQQSIDVEEKGGGSLEIKSIIVRCIDHEVLFKEGNVV